MKRINITCPACGSRAYLRPASVVYGDKAPDPDAKYYVCGRYPACDCYVAAHRKTMLPMGTLADKALRKKRHDAHVALDSLWKNGIMSRKEAYRLLQLSMGLPAEDAHIAKFSAARCDEVIALSRRFRAAAARAAYQAAHPPPDDAFDALRARLLLHDLFLLADEEQALLIRHRLHGCSLAETARREGMSVKRVRHRLKALYRAYFAQKETKQKEL